MQGQYNILVKRHYFTFLKKTNVAPYRLRLHTNSVNIPQGETGDMTRVSFCPSEISVCHISGTRCVHRSQEKKLEEDEEEELRDSQTSLTINYYYKH